MSETPAKELATEILVQCSISVGADYFSLPGSALDKLAVWKVSFSFDGPTSAWFRLLQERAR
jgi:hypothetical protein